MSIPRATLRVDLDALVHNWHLLDAAARPGRSAAVVKANAYGLGAVQVARALLGAGCRTLFVATCDEALALRDAGIDSELYVFEGALRETAAALAHARVSPVLNDAGQCEQWRTATASLASIPGHAIHVDTGMSRLGFPVADFLAFASGIPRLPHPSLLVTHLACADEPAHPQNAAQLAAFARCRAVLPGVPSSIGNSAGAVLGASTRGDVVRPGIALYGGNPFVDRRPLPLREVVHVRAPVLQVRQLPSGAPVGYGATHVTMSPRRVATLGIGYADGYPRSLGERGWGELRGVRVPVLGRVSMDLVVVDLTDVPGEVLPGDAVTMLGGAVGLDALADAAGTIAYELLTRLGPRFQREHVHEDRRAGHAVGRGADDAG